MKMQIQPTKNDFWYDPRGMGKFMSLVLKHATKILKPLLDSNDETFKKNMSVWFLDPSRPLESSCPILSPKENHCMKILYSSTEIMSTYQRLRHVEIFLPQFRNCKAYMEYGITRLTVMRYHIEKYFEEIYLLTQRMKIFVGLLKKI